MAKPYNHRRAENAYKKWKEKDERFMKKNGMPMDKILLMRDFDRNLTPIEDFLKKWIMIVNKKYQKLFSQIYLN